MVMVTTKIITTIIVGNLTKIGVNLEPIAGMNITAITVMDMVMESLIVKGKLETKRREMKNMMKTVIWMKTQHPKSSWF